MDYKNLKLRDVALIAFFMISAFVFEYFTGCNPLGRNSSSSSPVDDVREILR